MTSVKAIGVRGDNSKMKPEEFWKKYDAGEFGRPVTNINDPAFKQWLKDVAAMPAIQQVDAVAKKMQELNPGFEGKFFEKPKIDNGVVTEFEILHGQRDRYFADSSVGGTDVSELWQRGTPWENSPTFTRYRE